MYRIMALKSAEVNEFLENHLCPQVTELLGNIADADTSLLENKLDEATKSAKELGFNPEDSPRVKKLQALLKAVKRDQQTEADTYNHLCNFFSRYYDEGDFMSLRRYKSAGKEAYLIPYNGEEVKLHWANSDQYYIKTTENYASYVFTVDKNNQDCRVRFQIAEADNEKDNIKEVNGKKRLFVLAKDFVVEEKTTLTIRFDHRPLTEGEITKYPQNGNKQQSTQIANREFLKRLKVTG